MWPLLGEGVGLIFIIFPLIKNFLALYFAAFILLLRVGEGVDAEDKKNCA